MVLSNSKLIAKEFDPSIAQTVSGILIEQLEKYKHKLEEGLRQGDLSAKRKQLQEDSENYRFYWSVYQ